LSIFFVAFKRFYFIEIFRLEQSCNVVIINDNDIFGISANGANIFEEVGFVDDEAVFSVEAMRDPLLGVDHIDDSIGIELLTGCKDDEFIEFGHLKQEGVESKSFHRINLCVFAVEDYL
jgi:hypothetical protein